MRGLVEFSPKSAWWDTGSQFDVGDQAHPFLAALLPTKQVRSTTASFRAAILDGSYEECARLIALEHHREAHRNYALTGEVSLAALNEIERQVALFERASEAEVSVPKPALEDMVRAVLDARRTDDLVTRTTRADLYILARDGTEFYFEMKSPDPNKGQCLEVTQRLLRFHLARGQPRPAVQAYFAMAYNPYGPSRADYKWSFALNYMPFEQAVLIGQEFWRMVGGPTAYEELLEIYAEVGREKSKYMIDGLAFGF